MISEREAEERRLGDEAGLSGEQEAEDVGAGGCSGEIPHADLHGSAASCPEPVEAIPTYSMLPTGSHPWSVSSESAPVRPFTQSRPWEFDLKNTTGYEAVVTRIDWSLSPTIGVLQGLDIRLSASLDGAAAIGLHQLPVGQGRNLETQLRVPSEGRVKIKVAALPLPAQQAAFPGAANMYISSARIGEKVFLAGGMVGATGAYVSEVWSTGDWGASWQRMPDPAWVATGAVSMVAFHEQLVALVPGAASVGLWASKDNGLSWVEWIPDVSVIGASFGAPTYTQLTVVGGRLVIPYWNANSVGYDVYSSATGKTVASWGVKSPVNNGNISQTVIPNATSFAGRLVWADSVDASGNLQICTSADFGSTIRRIDTMVYAASGYNFVPRGRQLWLVNGTWGEGASWTDDLLNFHDAPAPSWTDGASGQRDAAVVVASEDRVMCVAGEVNGDPTVYLSDVWSGGMVYPVTDTVLYPVVTCSGFYLPPEC